MPTAFVLINTEIGSEEEVATELRKLENVREAYVVYGVYDSWQEWKPRPWTG